MLHNGEKWTEYDVAQVLENYRRYGIPLRRATRLMSLIQAEQAVHGIVLRYHLLYRSECRSVGSHNTMYPLKLEVAVIHYMPPEEGSSVIDREQIYLCDSGGEASCLRTYTC